MICNLPLTIIMASAPKHAHATDLRACKLLASHTLLAAEPAPGISGLLQMTCGADDLCAGGDNSEQQTGKHQWPTSASTDSDIVFVAKLAVISVVGEQSVALDVR